MEIKEKVSIICPVYNAAQYLDSCIISLIEQTYRNIEILLIDDGSNDASYDICDKWVQKDSRIKVFHKNQGGVSSARNIGIKESTGEYLFFIDADDTVEKNTIEFLLKYHNRKKDTITISNYDRFTNCCERVDRNLLKNFKYKKYDNPTFRDFISARHGGYIWGMCIPKILVIENKIKFNEEMHNLEDVAWIGILISQIKEMIFLEINLYHYRRTPNSITSNSRNYQWQAECWMQVGKTFHDYFDKKIGISKKIGILDRYCKNNFYAESFIGKLSYEQMKNISKKYNNPCNISWVEFTFYKIAFRIHRLLR